MLEVYHSFFKSSSTFFQIDVKSFYALANYYLAGSFLTTHCRGGYYVKRNIGNTWGRDMGYSLRMWRLMSLPSTASTEAII